MSFSKSSQTLLITCSALVAGSIFLSTSIDSQKTSPNIALASSPATTQKIARKQTKVADNGAPFPSESGYINGYAVRSNDGRSSITIDNSRNNSDVFVKLYSSDSPPKKPERAFFIRAGEEFTANNVTAGIYNIRYKDLSSGSLSRSEPFTIQEIRDDQGIRFSRMRITLYKVANGNTEHRSISEEEF